MSRLISIPRRYLFVLAGIFWTIAGVILCGRAFTWLEHLPLRTELVLESLSAAFAVLFYTFLFVRIVRRNISRIGQLPERASIFSFTAWQGYLMIGGMIALGITLRHSPIPKTYLAVAYTTMGIALLIGSLKFFKQFRSELKLVSDAGKERSSLGGEEK